MSKIAALIEQPTKELVSKTPNLQDLVIKERRHAHEILALEKPWKALESQVKGAVFFQSFEWCKNAIEHFGNDQDGQYRLYCAYDREELVAVLPLKVVSKRFRTVLTGLSEPYQQYTGMLLNPKYDGEIVFGMLTNQFYRSGADYVHFGQVRCDDALSNAKEYGFQSTEESKAALFVDLKLHDDFEGYFKTIKAKTRKNMRNARNRLEREMPIEHAWASEGDLLHDVIKRTYAGRLEWQERMGLSSRAFQDKDFEAFLDVFNNPEKSKVDVLALSLKHGDKPIADQWGFVFNGCYYAYISTWDTEYEEASPGRMHLGEVIKTGYVKGLNCVDFLPPDVPYKKTWSTGTIGVEDLIYPMTLRGRLFATVWLKWFRPAAKKTMQNIPIRWRKKIVAALFNRD